MQAEKSFAEQIYPPVCPRITHRYIKIVSYSGTNKAGKGFYGSNLSLLNAYNITNAKKIYMKFSTFLLLIVVIFGKFASLHAQSGQLKGRLTDEEGEALPFATVALLNAADSALVKAGYTLADGSFILAPLAAGEYRLRTSLAGYSVAFSDKITLSNDQILDLGVLALKSSELAAVEIESRRALVEVTPEKVVLNVEGTILSMGSDALSLLRKAPGVVVDPNDNLVVQGRGGVRVYIDGRPSPLTGAELANWLRSMPSDAIESIEIITQPSARYEAAGTAGIINIRLKKDKRQGSHASLTLGWAVGIFPKYNGSADLSHRTKKVHFFGTYSNNSGPNQSFMHFRREQNGQVFDQNTTIISNRIAHVFKAGADLSLGSRHTAGFVLQGNQSDNDDFTNSRTLIQNQTNSETLAILRANSSGISQRYNYTANLNYRYRDTSGTSFTFDADYGEYDRQARADQPNYYYDAEEQQVTLANIYSNRTPTHIGILTFKADYERKMWGGVLSFGGKYADVNTDNTFDFFNVINQVEIRDTSRSNSFTYQEQVSAAYVQYQRTFGKWGFQGGLRAERTYSLGVLTSDVPTSNDRVERRYINLFPSAGISYNPGRNHQWSLSFSRRIDRPNYQDLNPFQNKLDELSYSSGNPFLKPQYTAKYQLSHTFKYTLNTSITYSDTRDYFAQVTDTIESVRSFITSLNLDHERVASLSVSYPFSPMKNWNIYASATLSHSAYTGQFEEGKAIDVQATSVSCFGQNSFTLPKDFTLEISGFYSSPGVWAGTYKSTDFWGIETALQKNLWKKRATLKVGMSDIFHSMQWGGVNRFGGLVMTANGGWESRLFKVSFTAQLGNQDAQARRRKTGLEEEGSRAN
ncbi:MAG: TonB-dependent receptor [Bacteroidetes bacterium]|nr:MAG: TonB-dependent receptor [Bacteroidota bacterium]